MTGDLVPMDVAVSTGCPPAGEAGARVDLKDLDGLTAKGRARTSHNLALANFLARGGR